MNRHDILKRVLRKKGVAGVVNLIKYGLSYYVEPAQVNASPLIVQIEPAVSCNLKCEMCSNSSVKRRKSFLGFEEFKKIVDQFPYLEKISLVGVGEPLLNPELFDMIAYAKSKCIDTGFATNATLLTRDIAKKIVSSKCDWINISLDAASKGAYEEIRKGADFDHVLSNVRGLVSESKSGSGPQISVWFVLMKRNITEIARLVGVVKDLGIQNISVQGAHHWGSEVWKDRMAGKDLKKEIPAVRDALKKATILAGANGISFNYVNIPDSKTRRACKWPWYSCYITCDGYVTPCCLHGADPELINFGNIFERPFEQIWNNKLCREFRDRLKSKNPPSICVDCTSYYDKIKI